MTISRRRVLGGAGGATAALLLQQVVGSAETEANGPSELELGSKGTDVVLLPDSPGEGERGSAERDEGHWNIEIDSVEVSVSREELLPFAFVEGAWRPIDAVSDWEDRAVIWFDKRKISRGRYSDTNQIGALYADEVPTRMFAVS